MRGTVVCVVNDTDEGRNAIEATVELSQRLGLRLVLAHVAEGTASTDRSDDGAESVTMRGSREGAARLLARLAVEYGAGDITERRSAVGDPAAFVGQIAAEEAADLIVVGARMRGRLRRRLESGLADELEAETSVPILIAPPRARRAWENGRMNEDRR
jgi:nucleotide-binding universal stress UspA family protein